MNAQALAARQRRRLADQLESMTPSEWESPTLCEGWNARHVVAHILTPLRHSAPRIALGVLLAGGDYNRFADRMARRDARQPTKELVRELRLKAGSTWRPPRTEGVDAPLTDLVVHSLDILRPLGVESGIDTAALPIVLEHLVTPRSIEFFDLDLGRTALVANDVPWRHGIGPEVVGSAEDLILALARRAAPLQLSGAGAASWRSRHEP